MTTQATNPVDYARGVLQVETETLRKQLDEIAATAELMVAALDGGHQWEIQRAVARTVHLLNQLRRKDENR